MPETVDPTAAAVRSRSRRTVLKGAAWTAPAIVVMTTAPAFATSASVITPTYRTDSFRATNSNDLGDGVVGAGNYLALAYDFVVTDGGVNNLTIVVDNASGNFKLSSTHKAASRGSTSWAVNNGSLAADGWVPTPGIGSGDTSFSFTRPGVTTSGLFRVVFESVTSADYPLTVTFSAAEAPRATVSRTVSESATTPFVTGT